MTISSSNRKAGPTSGNGVADTIPFTFKVFSASEIQVTKRVVATEAETVLALTTDYTVTLNADQDADPGGDVVIVDPATDWPTGTTIVVTSVVSETQAADITNRGGFYASVINRALDKLTILIQQATLKLSRAPLIPITTPTTFDPSLPAPVANHVIRVNSDATGYESVLMATAVDAATAASLSYSNANLSAVNVEDAIDEVVTEVKNASLIDAGAIAISKLVVLDNAKIITSNGSANSQVAISGDGTMSNTGALTIANNAVTTAKILDANVTDAKLTTATQTKLGYIRNRQRVVAGLTADVSIAAGPIAIDWNYHSYTDLAGLHSTSSNPSRFVVPAGATRFNLHVVASTGPTAAQTVTIQLYKNGSASWIGGAKRAFQGNGDVTVLEFTTGWLSCVATDYFQVYIDGTGGQSLYGNSGADADESYVVFEVEST